MLPSPSTEANEEITMDATVLRRMGVLQDKQQKLP